MRSRLCRIAVDLTVDWEGSETDQRFRRVVHNTDTVHIAWYRWHLPQPEQIDRNTELYARLEREYHAQLEKHKARLGPAVTSEP